MNFINKKVIRNFAVFIAFIIPVIISWKAYEISKEANEIALQSFEIQQKEYEAKTEFILGGPYDKEKKEIEIRPLTQGTEIIRLNIDFPGEINSNRIPLTGTLDTKELEVWIVNQIENMSKRDERFNIPDVDIGNEIKGIKVSGELPVIINSEYVASHESFHVQNLYRINYIGSLLREGKFEIEHIALLRDVDLGTGEYSEEFLMMELERYLYNKIDTDFIFEGIPWSN
ncbi:hypothetical protein [Alteribacter keqinensis]|uniref:Uncharacterized protein n=1 Tax=Alteribacter keqinensis TaxID=2483800 RepID=A0A3M7TLJ7_9BACI|nr:hypothetical protein [Alteribacter keqinensis]RNA66214.1 hypothetical protein EBO34_18970 [Alteribacter keqinensis]